MKVRGLNGIEFDVEEAVATGMIAAGLLSAVDEDDPGTTPTEDETQPAKEETESQAKGKK